MAADEVKTGRVLTPREQEARERLTALETAIDSHGATAQQVADAASAVLTSRDWKYLMPGGYATVAACFADQGIWQRWEKARKPLEKLVNGFLDAGLTQKETAGLLGITQARVSQLHGGKTGNEARQRRQNISHQPEPAADQAGNGRVTYIPAPVAPAPAVIAPPPALAVAPAVTATMTEPVTEQAPPAPCPQCLVKDRRIAELAAEVRELSARLEPEQVQAPGCGHRFPWEDGICTGCGEIADPFAAA